MNKSLIDSSIAASSMEKEETSTRKRRKTDNDVPSELEVSNYYIYGYSVYMNAR